MSSEHPLNQSAGMIISLVTAPVFGVCLSLAFSYPARPCESVSERRIGQPKPLLYNECNIFGSPVRSLDTAESLFLSAFIGIVFFLVCAVGWWLYSRSIRNRTVVPAAPTNPVPTTGVPQWVPAPENPNMAAWFDGYVVTSHRRRWNSH